MVGKQFERKMVPSGFDVCEKQLFNFIDRVENIEVDEKQIEQYLAPIYKMLDWLQREDLIKHFVSVEFNRFLEYYKNAPDLNANVDTARDGKFGRDSRDSRDGRDRRSSRDDRDGRDRRDSRDDRDSREERPKRDRSMAYSRFFINVGEKEGLSVPRMIGLINDYCRRRDIPIGKIDILRKFSFFEVDAKFESHVLSSFANADFNGTPIEVTLSKRDTHGSQESSSPAFGGKKKSLGDEKPWKID